MFLDVFMKGEEMDTLRLRNLSEKCEELKTMWGELTKKASLSLGLLFHLNPAIDCKLDLDTTKDLADDLKKLLEAQIRKYEGEIKQIIENKDQ